MISISRLLCDSIGPGDYLRYRNRSTLRPVVVWNCTRKCNLSCLHCYANAGKQRDAAEMDTASAKEFIRDLASFGVPALLLSGGEPLLRNDVFELATVAREQGLRLTLSTNGTLIDREVATRLRETGFTEVGISLDGIGPKNDYFRGKKGAYKAALNGIRSSVAAGLRVSLRFTITQFNYEEIPAIFELVEKEGADRLCFYHLAYSGRGSSMRDADISQQEARSVVDKICAYTVDLYQRGINKEVLTVGNHADGIYLYLKLEQQRSPRADAVLQLLRTNGGNNSGIRIGAVDDCGNVHPDQFWQHYSLGNVQTRRFSEIWMDTSEPLLAGLRNRQKLLKGRCGRCCYLSLCNGNLRVRAESVFSNVWAEDPACYLTEQEIGLTL